MKKHTIFLFLVLCFFARCGGSKQEKIDEEKAIIDALALVCDSGARYEKQLTFMHRQEAHDIVPDSSFIWSLMIECGDSIAEGDKPLRRQVERSITTLSQLRETDTAIAPLKQTISHLQSLLCYLDAMKAFMDTSLTWSEHNTIHWPKPALRKSAASLGNTINTFNEKWDIRKNNYAYILWIYADFSKRFY